MSKQTPIANEFISLTIMALMIVALAAGQADATLNKSQAVDASALPTLTQERAAEGPAEARFHASFALQPLIITIDASAEVSRLIPDAR